MKKVLTLSILALGIGATQIWATPVAACTSTTLDKMLGANFQCEIGDKIFSNFAYTDTSSGGAQAVAASSVAVDTIGPNGSGADLLGPDIGLQFNASWTALPNQTVDSDISFTVTVIGGANMVITDTGLAQTSGVTAHNGDASVTEKACAPATNNGFPCTPNFQASLTFDRGGNDSQVVSDVIIAPTGSIRVSKDINVIDNDPAETRGSLATISLVSDTFSQSPTVPEPGTMALAGAVLCGLGLVRRRRRP